MEVYTQDIQGTAAYPLEHLVKDGTSYELSDFLFFDIETTGLSADISSLYLIGCLFYKEGSFHMIQWFADSYDSEIELLHAFFAELANHKVLLHYNGQGFDIPYLLKKVAQFGLNYSFDQIESIDLYKAIKPYKKILQLPNLKQKTIEEYLNITRLDQYTGKELIAVYGEYMKKKFARKENTEELSLLLLHNDEDLKGMLEVVGICHYIDLFQQRHPLLSIVFEESVFTATFALPIALLHTVKYHNEGLSFETNDQTLTLHVLLHRGELKYFYPNYKDYYYLPAEDTVVHKSVAEYVDKAYREKAKKSNCFLKKTGLFLPISASEAEEKGIKVFHNEYNDKQGFFEINEEMCENKEFIAEYLYSLLSNI